MSAISFPVMLADQHGGDLPAGLGRMCDAIEQRHGQAVIGIAFYGSCRRTHDATNGLIDLLVLVDDYRQALGSRIAALLNRALPPNVYYLQCEDQGVILRSKYAVIELDQLERRARARHDHYFWARFCQPLRLARGDQALHERLAALRSGCAVSFSRRIAPIMPGPMTALDFWTLALRTTYRCELRPEPEGAARLLIENDLNFWSSLSDELSRHPDSRLRSSHGLLIKQAGFTTGILTRISWGLRRISGKAMNLARLFKAAGTFSNGVDYLVWKVERHSGVKVEPTERMRRHPRLAIWGLAWQMWRQGGFR